MKIKVYRSGCNCKLCPWKGNCRGEITPHWIEIMINVSEMKDDELLAFAQKMVDMHNNRKNALNNDIHIERLKTRKVISQDHENCDKLASLKDHVNPEYKLLMEAINQEIVKRNLR
jgi:hypothetical protein